MQCKVGSLKLVAHSSHNMIDSYTVLFQVYLGLAQPYREWSIRLPLYVLFRHFKFTTNTPENFTIHTIIVYPTHNSISYDLIKLMLSAVDNFISSKLFLHLVLVQYYDRRKPKLTLFILDRSISSKLFFLEVQQRSFLIDPVLTLGET